MKMRPQDEGGEEPHSQLWRGREQIRGGKGEKEERWGREREGEVPSLKFFFFHFHLDG